MNSMLSVEDWRSLFLWFLERHGAAMAFRQNLPSLYGVLGKDALTEYVNRLAILFVLCNNVCVIRTERMFVYFWSIFFSVLALLFCFLLLRYTVFSSDAIFTWVKY